MPVTEIQNNFSQFKTNLTTAEQKPAEPKTQQQTATPAATEIKKDSFEKSTKFKTIGTVGYPLFCIASGMMLNGVKNQLKYLGSARGLFSLATTVGVGYLAGMLTDHNINKGRENKTTGKPTVLGATSAILGGGLIGTSYAWLKIIDDVNFIRLSDSLHHEKFKKLFFKKLKNLSLKGLGIGAVALGAAYFGIKALLKNSANKTAEIKSPDVKTTEAETKAA